MSLVGRVKFLFNFESRNWKFVVSVLVKLFLQVSIIGRVKFFFNSGNRNSDFYCTSAWLNSAHHACLGVGREAFAAFIN